MSFTYTDADLLAWLRRYADSHGGAINGRDAWDAWVRGVNGPSFKVLRRRFGCMQDAASAAGLPYKYASPPRVTKRSTDAAGELKALRRLAAAVGDNRLDTTEGRQRVVAAWTRWHEAYVEVEIERVENGGADMALDSVRQWLDTAKQGGNYGGDDN